MTIAIDVRMINASGIGTYLKNIVPGILEYFSKVYVLGNPAELNTFPWAGQVNIIAFTAKTYSLKEQILYPKVIPFCDVYWSPHFNAPLLPVKAKQIVTTIHDVYHISSITNVSLIHRYYALLLIKNAIRKSRYIFTVSGFSKSEIIKYTGARPEKISVVYAGINTAVFTNQENKDLPGLALPDKYMLFVGNVKPHKNLITLLKAYNRLPKALKNEYKIVIIGKKDGFITADNYLMQYIKSNNMDNNIIFTGYIEDVFIPLIYRKAALFIFPSLYEGFGLPILEALATLTPVLCSDAASLPEVGADAVVYFNPLDSNDLKSKIEMMLTNDVKSFFNTEKAKKQTQRFTWESSVKNHIDIFKKLE